jgi:quercetin dioxygenase-like cupin family protein
LYAIAPAGYSIALRYQNQAEAIFQTSADFSDPLPGCRGERDKSIKENPIMLNRTYRNLFTAGGIAIASLMAGSALAGECPADKMGVDVTPPGPMQPSGVTDNVLASIDLSQTSVAVEGRDMRLRRLVIEPGGIVPWHSHSDRPAIIYVVSGSVTEYRSTCALPIVHNAGEATPEMRDASHWWKNTGSEPAVLLSADILHDPADQNAM